MADPVDVPFGLISGLDSRNSVLRECDDPRTVSVVQKCAMVGEIFAIMAQLILEV